MLLEILGKAPTEAWVGLGGVIFGSLLTTFGVWLTNRSNAKQAAQRLEHEERVSSEKVRKERLEELYVLVGVWGDKAVSDFEDFVSKMRGFNLDEPEFSDGKGRGESPLIRIGMIISIYSDTAVDSFGAVEESFGKVSNLQVKSYMVAGEVVKVREVMNLMSLAIEELQAALREFKAAIAVEARSV
ncbi:hypothetical protein RZO07_10530 [Pseudomonas protegens]|uniref:hypothetical protein n=1 Tax=Pseudomonas protegens TaxID=380021 RepID=UPI0029373687|nr:hypothetical protein [Pseudomonas protegens]WOE81636.1 hypothetical protein RZO07_10530 [Pseudomonas protegens]